MTGRHALTTVAVDDEIRRQGSRCITVWINTKSIESICDIGANHLNRMVLLILWTTQAVQWGRYPRQDEGAALLRGRTTTQTCVQRISFCWSKLLHWAGPSVLAIFKCCHCCSYCSLSPSSWPYSCCVCIKQQRSSLFICRMSHHHRRPRSENPFQRAIKCTRSLTMLVCSSSIASGWQSCVGRWVCWFLVRLIPVKPTSERSFAEAQLNINSAEAAAPEEEEQQQEQ